MQTPLAFLNSTLGAELKHFLQALCDVSFSSFIAIKFAKPIHVVTRGHYRSGSSGLRVLGVYVVVCGSGYRCPGRERYGGLLRHHRAALFLGGFRRCYKSWACAWRRR